MQCADTIGLRNASHLAPAAFLASADGASALVQQLLPSHLSSSPYSNRETALSTWELGLPDDTPLPPAAYMARSHGTNPELNSSTHPSCPTAKMTYLGTVFLQLPPSTVELNWLN